jgi:hypothetical protein
MGVDRAPAALALIARRQGQWDKSVAYWEQTLALDPRNTPRAGLGRTDLLDASAIPGCAKNVRSDVGHSAE